MRLLAPAKINLHLRVGPRREDGFHSLLSWMTTAGLFDSLVLQEQGAANSGPLGDRDSSASMQQRITLSCDLPGLPTDQRNLVVQIALAWGQRARSLGCATRDLRMALEKRIPVGAGLGGGSSDAARTLMGLNRLWRTRRAADDLSAFAARYGSDLPFFFHGPSSICAGRGEVVTPIYRPMPRWAVLVLPGLAMPTGQVYQRFDEMGLGRDADIEDQPPWNHWARLDSEKLMACLVNDLEPPAFALAPQLSALRQRIEQIVSRPVRMSGSGSSLFTLFDDCPQAQEAGKQIESITHVRAPIVEVAPALHDDLNKTVENR